MKRYKHLFEKLISEENIMKSLRTAKRGNKNKCTKRKINKLLADKDIVNKMTNIVYNYYNAKHEPKEIYDGISRKKRTIIVPNHIELI